ncbi:MAG: T9SS type A sorting domain-containing protein [Bacteroidales bacterium]|nr:T9SS type A sorting domain-containing protein [Bacteroidales bacterium]
MRRIITIIVALIICVSQSFAQLVILNGQEGDEVITNTTVNIQAGVETNYYFRVKNTGSTTIENIKSFLLVNGQNATYGTDAIFQLCTEPGGQCGMGAASPKFKLDAGATKIIHLNITTMSTTDFVISTHPDGSSTPEASFNIHAGTSGIESNFANTFNVYPSPANESFTIENSFGQNSYVEIYNVLGQMVKHVAPDNANRISVNCSTWKNGYYVCRLYKDGKVEKTMKIVVAH